MKKINSTLLQLMGVVTWMVFVFFLVETSSAIFSIFFGALTNLSAFYDADVEPDPSNLFTFSQIHYFISGVFTILLPGIKTYIAYLLGKVFLKFDLSKPFNAEISTYITRISYCAISAAVVIIIAKFHTIWLIKKGLAMSNSWAFGETLFYAGIIYILAKVFERGTELQAENEYTV